MDVVFCNERHSPYLYFPVVLAYCKHVQFIFSRHYLLGTRCDSPHQSQQKPQPVPGQTCQSAQSDPGGQSALPKKTHYSGVLGGREREKKSILFSLGEKWRDLNDPLIFADIAEEKLEDKLHTLWTQSSSAHCVMLLLNLRCTHNQINNWLLLYYCKIDFNKEPIYSCIQFYLYISCKVKCRLLQKYFRHCALL